MATFVSPYSKVRSTVWVVSHAPLRPIATVMTHDLNLTTEFLAPITISEDSARD